MGNNAVASYGQVIEKTKSLSFTSQMLAINIEKIFNQNSRSEAPTWATQDSGLCLGVELTPGCSQNVKEFTRTYNSSQRRDLLKVKKGERESCLELAEVLPGQSERESYGETGLREILANEVVPE